MKSEHNVLESNEFAEYIKKHIAILSNMENSPSIDLGSGVAFPVSYLNHAIGHISLDYDWAEFGVYTGGSARHLEKHLPENSHLYLFDSFDGLPEAFAHFPKGHFSLTEEERPKFDGLKTTMIIGLFENTLPLFLKDHPEPLAFLHIDSDLYSSARTIFNVLSDLIIKDTVIMFDEFGLLAEEGEAFLEFAFFNNTEFKFLGMGEKSKVWVKLL